MRYKIKLHAQSEKMVAQAKRWLRTSNVGTYIKNASQKPDSRHYFFLIHLFFFWVNFMFACLYLPCWVLWFIFSNSVQKLWRNLKSGKFSTPVNNGGVGVRVCSVDSIYSLKIISISTFGSHGCISESVFLMWSTYETQWMVLVNSPLTVHSRLVLTQMPIFSTMNPLWAS